MHLDATKTPICRTDNFYETQVKTLEYINELVEKHKAIRLDAGDIFDRAVGKSPTEAVKTIGMALTYLKDVYAILGNHDVKNRNVAFAEDSNIWIPIMQGNIKWVRDAWDLGNGVWIHGVNYGEEIKHNEYRDKGETHILLYHGFVDEKENTLIGGLVAKDILKEFHADYDYIITADHHKPFTCEYEGSVLINVGSLFRLTASQKDYKPRVWLLDTDTGKYEPIFMPIDYEAVSDEHLVIEQEREERIASFIFQMDNEFEITSEFAKNVEKYIMANKKDEEGNELINKNTETFVFKAIDGGV